MWLDMSDCEHEAHKSNFARRALFECLGKEWTKSDYKSFLREGRLGTAQTARQVPEATGQEHVEGIDAIEAYTVSVIN